MAGRAPTQHGVGRSSCSRSPWPPGLLAGCASHDKLPPPRRRRCRSSARWPTSHRHTAAQKASRTATVTLTGSIEGQPKSDVDGVGVVRMDDEGPSMQVAEQLDRGPGVPGDPSTW